MKIEEIKNESKFFINTTIDELITIGNAFNEVCNGFQIDDFNLKIGISEDNADLYLEHFIEIYKIAKQIGVEKEDDFEENIELDSLKEKVFKNHLIKVISIDQHQIVLEASKEELKVIFNVFREVCAYLEEWDCEIRMGVPYTEVLNIMKYIESFVCKKNQ